VQGHRPPFYGERNQTSVWEITNETSNGKRVHPTQKPVEIFAIPMRNHTKPGEVCFEPFGGSGSQLVAAEQLGRRCFAMELDPRYAAVILERMAGMGLQPKLVESRAVQAA
jgi:DNA modification methylase